MARGSRLTQDEVFPAIWQLFASGKHPQQTSLREALGNRGSPPVLQSFINDWHQEFAPKLAAMRDGKPAPAPATTELQDELKRLTQAAIEQMDAANAERATALDDRASELEDAAAALEAREDDLLRRERAQEDREQAHQEFVEELRTEARSARQERVAAQESASQAATALAAAKESVLALQRANDDLKAERADAKNALASAQKAGGAAEARIQELERYVEQLKEQIDRANAGEREAQQAVIELRIALEAEIEGVSTQLEQTRAEYGEALRDLSASREQTRSAADSCERLRTELGVCGERLEAEGRAAASAQAEVAALKKRLATADDTRKQLSSLQAGFEKLRVELTSFSRQLPAEKPKRG